MTMLQEHLADRFGHGAYRGVQTDMDGATGFVELRDREEFNSADQSPLLLQGMKYRDWAEIFYMFGCRFRRESSAVQYDELLTGSEKRFVVALHRSVQPIPPRRLSFRELRPPEDRSRSSFGNARDLLAGVLHLAAGHHVLRKWTSAAVDESGHCACGAVSVSAAAAAITMPSSTVYVQVIAGHAM